MEVARFGPWVFNRRNQVLLREGEVVPLQPKAMRLLEILVDQAPSLVRHRDLIDQIWPDVVVAAANLKNLVSELRSTIDPVAGCSYIRTVRGRGYAFAPVLRESDRPPARSRVRLRCGGKTLVLSDGSYTLGRQIDCEIHLDHSTISRRHAILRIYESVVTINDLGSKNGTFVGTDQISRETLLCTGATLRLGDIPLRLLGVEETPTDTMTFSEPIPDLEKT